MNPPKSENITCMPQCVPGPDYVPVVMMSGLPQLCQFSSTEAISLHRYNLSVLNQVQGFSRGFGYSCITNFVKMFAFVKNNYIHLLLFVLLLTISDNVLPFLPIKLVAIAQGGDSGF